MARKFGAPSSRCARAGWVAQAPRWVKPAPLRQARIAASYARHAPQSRVGIETPGERDELPRIPQRGAHSSFGTAIA